MIFEDILKKYYDYIYQAICEEGIILKAPECNLFKELVFENKVVGFWSYDFSREFITAALNNIYVLPKFRGNNLFLEELEKTMLDKYVQDSKELWEEGTSNFTVVRIGSTIGTHVGPGAIAVGFFPKGCLKE